MDYTIRIGGASGQGLQTIGDALTKIFSRSGYHLFSHKDYESRVRGGHNFFQIRFSDKPVSSSREKIDIIMALDTETITRYEKNLSETGYLVYDSSALQQKHDRPGFLDIPFSALAIRHGGSKIMENIVATGAVLGMLGLGLDILIDIINEAFSKKGADVIKANIDSAKAGHDYAMANCPGCTFGTGLHSNPKMLITVVDAIGASAIASGCKFYSGYPMTPSTGIMTYLAGRGLDYGIVVEQAEDEISAINMALGASFAGVRAMTGSAGGGFALMVEGVSLCAMTETPLVIGIGMRPAPATGLPTRTEQGDLLYIVHSSHGEFPRIVFAPGNPEQAFYQTNRAFDLSEKYQIPVFIMYDQYLSDAQWTYDNFDLSRLKYKDYRLRGESFKSIRDYKRYAFTEDGVSPLGVPGDAPHLVIADSDEHNEEGRIIEDSETRIRMMQKRLFKKLPQIKNEMEPPLFYGDSNPEILLAGWGSNYGLLKESVDLLSKNNRIAMLHFSDIYPFAPVEKFDYIKILKTARMTICIENNATGQFARLMKSETGYEFNAAINKYDGRPFILEELTGEINEHARRL